MKNGKATKRLYELEMPVKIYEEVTDGSSFFTVDHLDGMYSYCISEKGSIVHLAGGTPLIKYKDGYKIYTQTHEQKQN